MNQEELEAMVLENRKRINSIYDTLKLLNKLFFKNKLTKLTTEDMEKEMEETITKEMMK